MAQLVVVYWRDIPAQIVVRRGRASERRELPARFMEAIDMAAMRSGARDSDAYLAQWRKSEPTDCGDDIAGEAEMAVNRLDGAYDQGRLRRLIDNGGHETVTADDA